MDPYQNFIFLRSGFLHLFERRTSGGPYSVYTMLSFLPPLSRLSRPFFFPDISRPPGVRLPYLMPLINSTGDRQFE